MFILNRLRELKASLNRKRHGWSTYKPIQSVPGYNAHQMLLQDHLPRTRRIGSRRVQR